MQPIIPLTQADLNAILQLRDGETKLGENIHLLQEHESLSDGLARAKNLGARFAIIGISEDIGPRANLGRGGADNAFTCSISQFANLQANRYLQGSECMIVGQIKPSSQIAHAPELSKIARLRAETALLDEQVIAIATAIMRAGLEPIVIGGGHNNAYGLLMATKQHTHSKVAAVNLDPHADFRLREGRHSGNGFSYAAASGALGYYHVLGLHELKNSESSLTQLETFGGQWHSLQSIWIRKEISLTQALTNITNKLNNCQQPVALELDVDAIINMPSSASSRVGVPLNDALHYVSHIAKHCPCQYLHIAEAAPQCHTANSQAGFREVGQSVSELICAYIQSRRHSVAS